VDPRLHHLQGKTELVTDLLPVLQEFHRDKLAMMLRHVAGARQIGQYDANNTYQYVINREEAQLTWLATAITELGGTAPDAAEPTRAAKGKPAEAARAIFEEDLADAQRFVDQWRPRIAAMNNARHAKMLRVIVGETLEHKRFFEQALAGRQDLLGKRGEQLGPSYGEVLSSRWIE
jgi:hypothetical protein